MKAILIDVAKREVRPVECTTIEDIKALIGGGFELGHSWSPDGSCHHNSLYVHNEGLFSGADCFLFDLRPDQPLHGNGVVCGTDNSTGESMDVNTTVEEITRQVEFVSLKAVKRIARDISR